jgi:hypothetical protein
MLVATCSTHLLALLLALLYALNALYILSLLILTILNNLQRWAQARISKDEEVLSLLR